MRCEASPIGNGPLLILYKRSCSPSRSAPLPVQPWFCATTWALSENEAMAFRTAVMSACRTDCDLYPCKMHSSVLIICLFVVGAHLFFSVEHQFLKIISCESRESDLELFVLEMIYLCLSALQGHKWIWGNQEICGHKVSSCVPHASRHQWYQLWLTCSTFSPSCHLPGYQKASEPGAIGRGWNLRGCGRRDPVEVVLALREAALGCGCQVHHSGPFLLSCTHGTAGGRVAFEAEVCHLSTGTSETSNGVRYTRLWGAPLAFRDIATQISKDLELWRGGRGCVPVCVFCVFCVCAKGIRKGVGDNKQGKGLDPFNTNPPPPKK